MAGPLPPYEMGDLGSALKREAPAAARNRAAIAEVLERWLPASGLVLEIASGSGEHVLHFARAFPGLDWQPSDRDPDALASIGAWRREGPTNLLAPIEIDAAAPDDWPIGAAAAVLNVNMAHISPWAATLGLLDGAASLLSDGAPLIFYGPWLADDIETAPSNLAFDQSLKSRDPRWGLRRIEDLKAAAQERGFAFEERVMMPANNVMLRFIRRR